MEFKPCPFCGNQEAVEYSCGHDMYDCPLHYEYEFIELGYDGECGFDCEERNTFVICNAQRGGCGASSGYCKGNAADKWNMRVS